MAASVSLLFRAFLVLLCIVADVAVSRQRNDTIDGKDLLKMQEKKPYVPPTKHNVSTPQLGVAEPVSDYMIRLFLKLAKPSGEVINPAAVKGGHVHGVIDSDGSSDRSFKFNVSIPGREIVKLAELLLYKMPSTLDTYSNFNVTVNISDIYSGKQIASRGIAMELVGWISFVLPQRIILRWNRNPQSNAGLLLEINGPQNVSKALRFATRQINVPFQPLLVIHCSDPSSVFAEIIETTSKIKPVRRSARSVHPIHKGKCQLHKLDVHFKDLEWDKWVIVPKWYSANYCAGTCLDRYDPKLMSNHALLQLIMHQKDHGYASALCCAPDRMGSISMLLYGQPGKSTYVLKSMKDFVVKSCGCH